MNYEKKYNELVAIIEGRAEGNKIFLSEIDPETIEKYETTKGVKSKLEELEYLLLRINK